MSSPATRKLPVAKPRHDGWTVERQKIFIRTLGLTRNVSRAAAAAGMSRESAYRLRRRAEGVALAQTWDSILSLPPFPGGHSEDHARRVADLHGVAAFAGKVHQDHGSHKTATHRQPGPAKSRAELQSFIDRACAG